MKQLIGKKIISLKINGDQTVLMIESIDEIFMFLAEGDCCSETWFAEIIGVNYLIGATVLKVDNLDLPDYNLNDGKCRQAKDTVYGIRLITDKGETDIIYRNSSNGYYGGSIQLLVRLSNLTLTEIKEDWSA